MRISVFGLGYVGSVSAACLARVGHDVVGVDSNAEKVAAINSAQSPIIEPGLPALIAETVALGRIRATVEAGEAVTATDVSFVCVGTPSTGVGSLDLQYVRRVCEQIGTALRHKSGRHVVVVRSTVLPGTTEDVVIPILCATSGKQAGRDFGVCYNPEFLREGSALSDFQHPPRTVIGEIDQSSGDLVDLVYQSVEAPVARTDLRTAEMVKYSDNAFHALKIAFSNEIGNLCKAMQIDSHAVMDIFVQDTKLNLSAAYLKPGYAFGGSCLPKDLRALIHRAGELDVDTALLRSVLRSNERQKRVGFEMIRRTGRKKIGVLGLSFKQDTDDLRESPAVELVETLLGKGYDVAVYDRNISLPALVGSNRAYIERELPHLSSLMRRSIDEVLSHAELVVITNRDREFADALHRLRPDQLALDFARVWPKRNGLGDRYEGICW